MKPLLLQYSAYHVWANALLLDAIVALPPALHTAEAKSSFLSLQATVIHLLDSESIWWQRLKLQEHIIRPSENLSGGLSEAVPLLKQLDQQWHEWINKAKEPALEHVFQYQNTKRELFKQPVYQMLLHVFNHGTYHRGQLVTQLRQLGVDKIPATDFIVWSRKGILSL